MIDASRFRMLGLLIVWAVAAVTLLRGLGIDAYQYPDADRIIMDGVFIHDFLRDFAFVDLYQYTLNYYAQYPALSIGYRPPFFPFIESIFNWVFGINTWSSRLALYAMAVVGIGAWYFLVERIFDTVTAFFTSLLIVTNPFLMSWGWYTMAEVPLVSMTMLTAMVFHRYVDTGNARYLYWTALLLGLCMWTKQTAFYLGGWFLIYLLVQGQLISTLKRREAWFAIIGILILAVPLALITLWLGDQNLAQSVGTGKSAALINRFSPENLMAWWVILYKQHIPLPVLAIGVMGLLWTIFLRDRKPLYFILLILSTYLFFTYIVHNNSRYAVFWIPAFAVMASVPLYYLREHLQARRVAYMAYILLVGYQINLVYEKEPMVSYGYDEAAAYVLEHSGSPTVFFDGYNNGYFTYFMRAKDPERSMYVLRGDKLITSSSIAPYNKMAVHANTSDDIKKILDDYSVEYVVVESENRIGPKSHDILRELLKTGSFDLEKRIPIKTNRAVLSNQDLLIYRYRERKQPTADFIVLHLPVVGKTIRVPFRQGTERSESRLGNSN